MPHFIFGITNTKFLGLFGFSARGNIAYSALQFTACLILFHFKYGLSTILENGIFAGGIMVLILFYLFGKVAMDLGEKSLALDSLHKAAIFDCAPFRGNLVYNKIMLDVAQTDTHPLIDFEALVSSHLLEGDAFIDDTYVQNTYYQLLTTDLSKIIKHIFQI